MRRKTLRNTLAGVISAGELAEIGIDPGRRAQELPVAAFVTIANRLAALELDRSNSRWQNGV
jgi:16S rRNA (adenine1518-N6/adenine1519-N6)-dimethyltransferase